MPARSPRNRRLPTAALAAVLMLDGLAAQTPPRDKPSPEAGKPQVPKPHPPKPQPPEPRPPEPRPPLEHASPTKLDGRPEAKPDAGPTAEPAAKPEPQELPKTAVADELKSAFVLQFARYVEWPNAAPPRDSDAKPPLTIAVVGDANLGSTMARVLADKQVDARPIVVKNLGPFVKLTDRAALRQCQVLVFASDDVADWLAIRDELGKSAVLTVSTMPGFGKFGGMIELYADGKGLRFEVVQRPLSGAGLTASSKLLRLSQPRARARAEGDKK